MRSALDILFMRRPTLRYVSPGVCEAAFSGSGAPIIILDGLNRAFGPTGLTLGGIGGFLLSWNNYPGALCFSVYKAVDELDPFGAYVLIAECIDDNFIDLNSFGPGVYRVTAITNEGESEPSDPIVVAGAGSVVVFVQANPFVTDFTDSLPPGKFIICKEGFHSSDLVVNFVISGTAESGVDYETIETSAVIPAFSDCVEVLITALQAPAEPETVIMTLTEGGFYTIGSPDEATVTLKHTPCLALSPEPCWTPITPGDAVVLECGADISADDTIIVGGESPHSSGEINICAGPVGCSFQIRFWTTGDSTFPEPARTMSVTVGGVPMTIQEEVCVSTEFYSGGVDVNLDPGECILIQYNIGQSNYSFSEPWSIRKVSFGFNVCG